MPQAIDHSAIKTGQVAAILLLAAAFVTQRWELVAGLAAIFLITAFAWNLGPFSLLYRFLLKPLRLIPPDIRTDNLQPHRFGQAVGAVSAAAAATAIYLGYHATGWSLVGILAVLTAISFQGWCIGCFIYYQLNRLGLGGFFGNTPTDLDVPLGARPRRNPELKC